MARPKMTHDPFHWFDSSPEVIRLVVMMYVRKPLSLRNVEDLLFERGMDTDTGDLDRVPVDDAGYPDDRRRGGRAGRDERPKNASGHEQTPDVASLSQWTVGFWAGNDSSNSLPSTARSLTISARVATSSAKTSTANDAQPPWPSGARSWAKARSGLGKLRPPGDDLPFG